MGRRSDHTRAELYELVLGAARELAETDGLRGVNTRAIASRIGYSPGTLYNHFANLDDLIVHMNVRTLDALYHACADVSIEEGPEAALATLARRYIAFVNAHPKLWAAVLEHSLPGGADMPAWYDVKVMRLLGLAEQAIAPLFSPGREAERLHSARVLWGGLYGICALASIDKMPRSETTTALVDTLIEVYVKGLRAAPAPALKPRPRKRRSSTKVIAAGSARGRRS